MLLFALAAGALTSPRRAFGGLAWVLVLSVLLWQCAVILLGNANYYLPIATALTGGFMTYALTTAVNYRHEWEANWRADTSVALMARGAALLGSTGDGSQLHEVIRRTAREALQAEHVLLVLGQGEDVVHRVARELGEDVRAVLWPAKSQREGNSQTPAALRQRVRTISARSHGKLSSPNLRLQEQFNEVCRGLTGARYNGICPTLVAAPLPPVAEFFDDGNPAHTATGALIAIGRRDGRLFTERDAVLIESLARQAALALENQSYSQRLRSRVESADRELQDAYRILAEQSTKLFAAVESVDDALIVSDQNGCAVFVNAASARILGPASPDIGVPIAPLLRGQELGAIADMFDSAAMETRLSPEWKARCEVTRELGREGTLDQTRLTLAAQLTPLLTPEGESIGAMLVVADVSAQRELDNMKTDFVAFVAHELRTPLTTILGYSSLLQQDSGNFPLAQRHEMASAIMRHCRRLNRMITELLDLSRLEAGRDLVLRRESLDVVALCRRVIEAQRMALANIDDYTLAVRNTEPIFLEADPDRLEQILTNLVSNAVKYSPEGGEVRVEIEERDATNEVEVRVVDNGMGMSAEQVANLFQKYYRTPDAVQSGIKGTGLG
ncbi:MAG TPA: ATP-binding protein, partial [Abditibacteriaceae bacterium]